MKTQLTVTRKLWYVTMLVFAIFAFNPMYGQSDNTTSATTAQNGRTIKGMVSSADGPLLGVNVILKDSKVGTVTDDKGKYTFPKKLKTGDVLLISYLGFKTVEVKIPANTSYIETVLSEEVVEFMGSLNTNKRYKSKRSN